MVSRNLFDKFKFIINKKPIYWLFLLEYKLSNCIDLHKNIWIISLTKGSYTLIGYKKQLLIINNN